MAVEVIDKRTIYSKTFLSGKGKYTVDTYSYPIHYVDEEGKLVDIDTNIKKTVNTWEFTHKNTSNTFRTYFGDITTENIHLFSVEFGDKEKWINFKLKGAIPSGSDSFENSYIFYNCFDDVDVEYLIQQDNVKENIVLKAPTDRREFVFTCKFGGTKIEEQNGELLITDVETGETLWVIDKPYMIDAEGAYSDGVTYSLGNDGEFDTLTITVIDEDFLESAVYPVKIDPTVIVADDDNLQLYVVDESGGKYTTAGTISLKYASHYAAFFFNEFNKFRGKVGTSYFFTKAIYSVYYTYSYYSPIRNVYTITQPWGQGVANPAKPSGVFTTFNAPNGGWVNINLLSRITNDFYGIVISPAGVSSTTFATHRYSDVTKRPKFTYEYYYKPSLVFHDGDGEFYNSGDGHIYKMLDFGVIQSGMTATPRKVYLRNYSGYNVTNIRVRVETPSGEGVKVEISKTQNPFIPEDEIHFDGTFEDGADVSFYVRVTTEDYAKTGGTYNLRANADIVS